MKLPILRRNSLFTLTSVLLSGLLPLKKNKVLFLSDVRGKLGGNLEFLYNEIDKKEYEVVLLLKPDRSIQRNLKEQIQLLYHLTTSKYILLDDASRAISLMNVRQGQKICQLWHASGAFKTFGYSRNDREIKQESDIWHSKYTHAIVSSEKIKGCYAEGFGIPLKNIKATGSPRTDIFFNKDFVIKTKNDLYTKYPYLKGKKIILFAPTYRGESLKRATYNYDSLDYGKIYQELKDEYIFIFKWHPAIYWNIGDSLQKELQKYDNFFYDFSAERDINDLLLVTDILITDYSSVIFDFALLKKPIVYYVYDLYTYLAERGLYFPFDDYVYGPVTKNTDELISSLKQIYFDEKKHKIFLERFMEQCDGNSTKKVKDWIFKEN